MKCFNTCALILSLYFFTSCMPEKPPVLYPGRTTVTETRDNLIVRIKPIQKPEFYNFINLKIFYSMYDMIGFSHSDIINRKNENGYILLTFRKPERGIKNADIVVHLVNKKSQKPEDYWVIID